MKRKLKIDLDEIAVLMEDQTDMSGSFLNTETGEIVYIPEELLGERCFDEDYVATLPGWEQELAEQARDVEENHEKYEAIPTRPSYEIYELMVEFAESIDDPRLRELLIVALDGKGAFGRFKRMLDRYPEEQKKWFALKDKNMKEYVRQWLDELEIESIR